MTSIEAISTFYNLLRVITVLPDRWPWLCSRGSNIKPFLKVDTSLVDLLFIGLMLQISQ